VEPITAAGGIIVPVPEYFPILQEICNKYGIYLIMDEVVCGFGRTGKFWGFEQFDVDPDMVSMAKGLASSYMPLSSMTFLFLLPWKKGKLNAVKKLLWIFFAKDSAISFFHHFIVELQILFIKFSIQTL